MKAGLQLKLAQHLTLTPQLQQSIRLLQLSTLELQQEIETALIENPLLELAEPDGQDASTGSMVAEVSNTHESRTAEQHEQMLDGSDGMGVRETRDALREQSSTATSDDSVADFTADRDGESDADAPLLDLGEWGSSGAGSFDDDDESLEAQRSSHETLAEHLRSQLVMVHENELVCRLVEMLIDSLDDNGYLALTKAELDELLQSSEAVSEDDWALAVETLQGFDPNGVGARDLKECLLLQLGQLPNNRDNQLAWRIVNETLEHLGNRDYTRIKKLLDIDDNQLKRAHSVIKTLTPRPSAPFSDVSTMQMVPDVIVRRSKRRWVAELNPIAVPKLMVNTAYIDMLQRQKEGRNTPLSTQLQEARWLVKNVAQRFDTILRVANEIVERQQAFFDHGDVAMRPLVLREIADALGLHESTVSRVTTQKYLTSLRGTYELKYFFGSHVATDAGGAASSTAIRAMIKSLISEEDPNAPLTDSRIAELLGEQGIIVARRTVAKYRELQGIDPVNLRKRS